MLGRKEIVKKLIKDTKDDNIKWTIKIDRQWVRAEHSMEVTPNKILNFKLVYYTDHPKGTKLYVTFNIKHYKGSSTSHTIYDIGGKKKRVESKEMLSLMNDILLKEESNRNVIDKIKGQLDEYKPGPYELQIGDWAMVTHDPEFDMADGKEGRIVSEITDTDDTFYFLVDFEDPFYEMLVDQDFDFEREDFKVGGTCWPFEPQYLKKVIEIEDQYERFSLASFKEFIG
jgi:hypothetical protein